MWHGMCCNLQQSADSALCGPSCGALKIYCRNAGHCSNAVEHSRCMGICLLLAPNACEPEWGYWVVKAEHGSAVLQTEAAVGNPAIGRSI